MVAAIVTGWQTAWAHDWYPKHCCSGKDCEPLTAERVLVTPGGYVIDGIHSVPHGKALWSPDEHYHGCFPDVNKRILRCFWAPRPAM